MPAKPDASALVITVPEAEDLVGPWRRRHDPSACLGVPAHITLLYPFAPPPLLDPALLAELRSLFASTSGFAFALHRVDDHDGLLHLPPSPAATFVALTHALVARWPEYPHYRGKYGPDVLPHLSIGYGSTAPDAAQRAEITAAVQPGLPLACRAREVALLVRRDDTWSAHSRYALAPATP